jgi:hypothetical protein
VEEAVSRRLAELDQGTSLRAERRRADADGILRDLDRLLTADDKRAVRESEVDLYDDTGLPR